MNSTKRWPKGYPVWFKSSSWPQDILQRPTRGKRTHQKLKIKAWATKLSTGTIPFSLVGNFGCQNVGDGLAWDYFWYHLILIKKIFFETIWCNSCKFSCGECFCFLLRHKSFQFKCSQLVDKSHYIHFLHLWPPSPEDGPELVQATTNCQKHFRHLCPLFRHFCPKDVLVGGWVRKSGRQLPQLCSFPPPLPSFLTLGGIHKAEWMLLLIL